MKTPTYRIEFPGDDMDVPEYDAFSRLSPQGTDFHTEDPYRCPVSTPTIIRRQSLKSRNQPPPFIAFTTMNHSLQIPNNISGPKYSSKYKNTKSNRPMTKPQKKNFDCYFVNRIDKTDHIDAQTKSRWLTSLCAQPVDEIFNKYKRKSESNRISNQVSRSSNSTPGEKALMTAWSCNASCRGGPSSMSKYTKSLQTNSRTSFADQTLRVNGHDSDPDRILSSNMSFSLRPVTPATSYEADDTSISSRGSPMFHKVFRNNVSQNSTEQMGIVNSSVYSQYQRDKRFPEIQPRRSTYSPTRKRIVSETKETNSLSVTYPLKTHDLEESPMHIVSIGQGYRESPEPAKPTIHRTCSYRLPKKSLSMSLPELQGT